jgi:hypothetical protein
MADPSEQMLMARCWLAHCLGCEVEDIPEGSTCEIAEGPDGRMYLEASIPGRIHAIDCVAEFVESPKQSTDPTPPESGQP